MNYDLDFLVKPTEEKIAELSKQRGRLRAVGLDNMQGEMSIPQPLTVDVNNGMTEEDYNSCAFIVSVCQNLIQQVIVDNAEKQQKEPSAAIRSVEAWVDGFLKFPFPFFNFLDFQEDRYKEDNFSLNANADVVENIVNIKGCDDLKVAVVSALRGGGNDGKLVAYSNKDRDFTYFGVVTAYTQTEVQIRVICFTMHMQNTEVKVLCGGSQKTALDSHYVTYRFAANKALMIAMQQAIKDPYVENVAKLLMDFLIKTNASALKKFQSEIGAEKTE